jgi:thiamine-phosphate diphosphorylase
MLITDRTQADPAARTPSRQLAALEAVVEQAIEAGIDIIQVRERDLDPRVLRAFVARLVGRRDRSPGRPTAILVNDRADVALGAGADGVHLRGDGPPVARVRALSPALRVGRSVHSAGEAAAASDADWLVFGPVFETGSKPGAAAAGLDGLARACSASNAPVFAVGGLTPERAVRAGRAGASGVAAIGAFLPRATMGRPGGLAAVVHDFRASLESRAEDRLE